MPTLIITLATRYWKHLAIGLGATILLIIAHHRWQDFKSDLRQEGYAKAVTEFTARIDKANADNAALTKRLDTATTNLLAEREAKARDRHTKEGALATRIERRMATIPQDRGCDLPQDVINARNALRAGQ